MWCNIMVFQNRISYKVAVRDAGYAPFKAQTMSDRDLVELFKVMIKIRYFEERVAKLYEEGGSIVGPIHLYAGQEAVAAGVSHCLGRDDYIVSNHRGHGHCIAKGAKLEKMMAELFGKETGYNMGRSSSMHITSPDLGIISSSSVVAAGIPIAAGIGLSIKMRKTDQVVVSFFGDGASNNGNFHEGLNLAAVWKLPVVFVCENNLYAVSVPTSKSTSIEDISIRANSYGIMGYTINGMNVIEVANVVGEAVERARKGDGPTLIECKTYRFRAHGEGETLKYRANEEIQIWRERCPIQNLKERLIKTKILNEEEVSKIEHEVISQIEKAVQFAKESPFPQPIKEMKNISTPQLEEVIKI